MSLRCFINILLRGAKLFEALNIWAVDMRDKGRSGWVLRISDLPKCRCVSRKNVKPSADAKGNLDWWLFLGEHELAWKVRIGRETLALWSAIILKFTAKTLHTKVKLSCVRFFPRRSWEVWWIINCRRKVFYTFVNIGVSIGMEALGKSTIAFVEVIGPLRME